MTITRNCPNCKQDHHVEIRDEIDYRKWQAGFLIQNAMPYLSAADREILLTGYCDPCFKSLFQEDEAEDGE